MIIDVHCHSPSPRCPAEPGERFSFEPAEIDGAPAWDSFVSPRAMNRLTWRLIKRLLGLDPRLCAGPELDRILAEFYERHHFAAGPVDKLVLLAFDEYHDDAGRRVPMPTTRRQRGSDIYASNSMIRAACRRHPDRYLFGASVHPYRENAVACVEEVFARGACLLKWIPLHQNIDVADPRTLAVLRCCARLGLPVLVHYCEEFTLATQHPESRPLAPLLDALRRLRSEGAMPITIVAHVATPVMPWSERRSHRLLLDALSGEFADAPLYADISALASWGKIAFLRRLARRQDLHAKLLFGTDFPVPLALLRLHGDLGRDYRRIKAEPSWIQQYLHIDRRLGFNEIVFRRAAELLPHVRK
jgi:uncharacterized protein